MDGPQEVMSVLSGSPHRLSILRALRDAPRDLRDLRAELDVPRATVKHNLTRLQEHDLVAETGATYRLTAFGQCVLREYADYRASVGLAADLQPFLEFVPPPGFEYDLEPLAGSTVTEATSADPHAPAERFLELLADTDRARVVIPVVVPMLAEELYNQVVAEAMELRLVVPSDLLSVIESKFTAEYEKAVECERLWLGLCEADIPYSLAVLDDTLVLGGYDDGNILRCLVENESASAVELGRSMFREYEDDAESEFGKLQVTTG
jgi:predicted transcriptional regulator